MSDFVQLEGSCLVTTRSVKTGRIIQVSRHRNTLFSAWRQAVVNDLVNGQTTALPRIMAISKDIVASAPQPTEFTNEIRVATSVYHTGSTIQIIAVLGATEGNSPTGNIKTIGFYYGSDATTTLATGVLGSIINTLDVAKDSTREVTLQYDITFS